MDASKENIYCQVCGCEIDPSHGAIVHSYSHDTSDELRVVYCLDCGTPHHKDCWELTNRCSTYGCACTKSTNHPPYSYRNHAPVIIDQQKSDNDVTPLAETTESKSLIWSDAPALPSPVETNPQKLATAYKFYSAPFRGCMDIIIFGLKLACGIIASPGSLPATSVLLFIALLIMVVYRLEFGVYALFYIVTAIVCDREADKILAKEELKKLPVRKSISSKKGEPAKKAQRGNQKLPRVKKKPNKKIRGKKRKLKKN